jgi:hypothetical protein
MNPNSRIILPDGVERPQTLENVRATPENNRPKFNLPQEVKDKVREFIPEAKEIATKIHDLLEKGHEAQVALVCQESVRGFLGEHIKSLLPQMARTFAQTDRMQILNFFQQVAQQRLSSANLSAEKIDKKSYELAISDFMSLISKVPAQVFPVEIGLPDLDLESSESATPPKDTIQGET